MQQRLRSVGLELLMCSQFAAEPLWVVRVERDLNTGGKEG